MYSIEFTNSYLKDLKKARRRGLDEDLLDDVIFKLANDIELLQKNRDHALKGDLKGYRECHILPDWLLIYKKKDTLKLLILVRTGTHSDLF